MTEPIDPQEIAVAADKLEELGFDRVSGWMRVQAATMKSYPAGIQPRTRTVNSPYRFLDRPQIDELVDDLSGFDRTRMYENQGWIEPHPESGFQRLAREVLQIFRQEFPLIDDHSKVSINLVSVDSHSAYRSVIRMEFRENDNLFRREIPLNDRFIIESRPENRYDYIASRIRTLNEHISRDIRDHANAKT